MKFYLNLGVKYAIKGRQKRGQRRAGHRPGGREGAREGGRREAGMESGMEGEVETSSQNRQLTRCYSVEVSPAFGNNDRRSHRHERQLPGPLGGVPGMARDHTEQVRAQYCTLSHPSHYHNGEGSYKTGGAQYCPL